MSNEVSKRCITLSAKGLRNIPCENYENNFKFIICGEEYACPSFVAEFLSNRVSKNRRHDCTICEVEVEIQVEDQIESKHISNCFHKIISLGFGSSVFFESREYAIVRRICIELEINELYETVFMTKENLNEENVIERLKYDEQLDRSCETNIDFAASHFFNLNRSLICEMSPSILFKILESKSLKLQSEDDLYDLVSSLISKDACYSILLECVKYEHLSGESIESFFNFICESIEFLTRDVWLHLHSRLMSGPSSLLSGRYYGCAFEYREGSRFEGIISFLTKQHGGNVHDLGIISIDSIPVYHAHVAKNVLDLNTNSLFQVNNNPDGWICFDFKEKRVNLHHYSLRTRSDGDGNHPVNWVIEGSVDKTQWVELDRHINCPDLRGKNVSQTFSVSGTGFFRLIRLRQTGPDSLNQNYLTLSAFELFGIVRTTG
jgi:uncharacterized protein YqgQ